VNNGPLAGPTPGQTLVNFSRPSYPSAASNSLFAKPQFTRSVNETRQTEGVMGKKGEQLGGMKSEGFNEFSGGRSLDERKYIIGDTLSSDREEGQEDTQFFLDGTIGPGQINDSSLGRS
jgi:hypothetical protein